ncbi:MFS transporter [Marinitoga sp. 1135]|uniref:Major Facilitator Superfamily transporter n=1 Tax=Marinitoga piezophila (strain DSM 14283 / JCM 11233 / KA3) TaxID=443254 RepID=H2J885_MARPK|nr:MULTISPECIES: MFS transporter [Marinitoga]AEX85569.1 Major Facilitator Superfamily transporter [Marinitoga piezophila KA3]APT76040.1 MFS transporter [Marinitoga sp. 1137]NUU95783.1 MFS transporter [Marinitoga sp. 1135]NUU97706.1 MFS transporter [Marinitoga sp. 1138]
MQNVKRNFYAFIWHAIFLAIASSFIEVNTVVSSLILQAGGGEFLLGLVTAISVGIPLLAQLFFAGFLVSKPLKKPYLLTGIYLRIFSLLAIGLLLISPLSEKTLLTLIIIIISIFSFSGVFAGVSYTDLLGKSIPKDLQRKFMSFRQISRSSFALLSAFLAKYILNKFEYPHNYSNMFLIASFSLFIASLGFWLIKEEKFEVKREFPSFMEIIKNIPTILSRDKNLLNYVIFSNLTGFGLIIIPFYVLLAKNTFTLSDKMVGNFLLLQMIGIVLSSFVWGPLLHKKGYKKILKYCIAIGGLIPILALILSKTSPLLYSTLFLLTGIAISARQMTFEGVLIEISDHHNRALYVGISGALNFVTALLPLIIGAIIKHVGFINVFIFVAIMIYSSLYFLNQMKLEH